MIELKVQFPSLDWLRALQGLMNENSARYQKLGYVDARIAVVIEADEGLEERKVYGLVFEAFRCIEVRDLGDPAELNPEFVMEAFYSVWKEMIQNIRENGRADLKHTLNYLSLPGIPMRVWSDDPLNRDKFFRYNQSLQEFFDASCQLETEFVI